MLGATPRRIAATSLDDAWRYGDTTQPGRGPLDRDRIARDSEAARLSSVYLDPSTLLLGASDEGAGRRAVPGAADALRNLREIVDEVVVLSARPLDDVLELPTGIRVEPALPRDLAAGAWFVTADPESPFGRPSGATTVLVGPRRAPGHLPMPRFDVQARDLPAAVIEILTREAMG